MPFKRITTLVSRALLLLSLALLQACATSGVLGVARDQFRHGSATEALQTLSEADVSRRDKLLLYMDRAMVAQAAGLYADSITALEQAGKLIDQLDYVSLRDQSTTLLSNDWAARYSGEYSERLWIHTFQMLNYLMIGLPEGAAVEARRAAALYDEHPKSLNQDLFTRSLMALSFQSAGQYDSANVEYRKLQQDFDIAPPEPIKKNKSELILFLASGFIEPKLAGDLVVDINARISFPYYLGADSAPPYVQLLGNENVSTIQRADTNLVNVSSQALAERGKSIAAKQVIRTASKYAIASAIEKENELVGDIAKMIFLALEQADTRSWETLPAHLSLLRLSVPAGEQSLTIQINGRDRFSGPVTQHQTLDLKLQPGEQQFKLIRLGVNPG